MWTVAKVQDTEVLHGSGCLGPGHPSSTCMRTNPAREGDEMETTKAAARHANPQLTHVSCGTSCPYTISCTAPRARGMRSFHRWVVRCQCRCCGGGHDSHERVAGAADSLQPAANLTPLATELFDQPVQASAAVSRSGCGTWRPLAS
jgi:hypothetical protein